MRIGIIGPSEDEITPFIEKMTDRVESKVAMLKFHSGKYKNIDVVALYCGGCKVNAAIAAQILIDRFNVTHIIVTGVSGGIDPKLKIGDTVIGTEIAYHDMDDGILTEYHPWMKSIYFKGDSHLIDVCRQVVADNTFTQSIVFGKIVTGETFIVDEGRDDIINIYNPLCVDMETAAFAHVCYANNIPFLAIRSISDTAEESGIEVFEKNCIKASNNSIAVLEKILENVK